MASDLDDLDAERVRRATDRELLQRAAREAHHAYNTAIGVGRQVSDLRAEMLSRLDKISARLGIVEGQPSPSRALEKLVLTEIRDKETTIEIRRKRADLVIHFGRELTKWLFAAGGGAFLYALLRALLGW